MQKVTIQDAQKEIDSLKEFIDELPKDLDLTKDNVTLILTVTSQVLINGVDIRLSIKTPSMEEFVEIEEFGYEEELGSILLSEYGEGSVHKFMYFPLELNHIFDENFLNLPNINIRLGRKYGYDT